MSNQTPQGLRARCSDLHASLAQPFLEERSARAVRVRHADLPVALRLRRFDFFQLCERGCGFLSPAELPKSGKLDT